MLMPPDVIAHAFTGRTAPTSSKMTMNANTKCAHDFLSRCEIENCKFVHRSNALEWYRAPHMDRATAMAILGFKEASGALRAAQKASKKKASEKGKKKQEKKQVAKPDSEEVEEVEEVDKNVVAPKALLLSASLERKVVPQTPSSQSKPVSSGAPASFLLRSHLAMAGISNLTLGYTEASEEKLAKILKILGTNEVD